MELRRDEQDPDREMMENVPQEPIAADPTEEDEAKEGAEEDDPQDEGLGQPVELEGERQSLRFGKDSQRRKRQEPLIEPITELPVL